MNCYGTAGLGVAKAKAKMKHPNRCGYYWWRGLKPTVGPWQVVEVFKQNGKLYRARCGRAACYELKNADDEQWGPPIPPLDEKNHNIAVLRVEIN